MSKNKKMNIQIKSTKLNQLIKLDKKEIECAIKIQRFFRYIRNRNAYNYFKNSEDKITTVQSYIRRYLCMVHYERMKYLKTRSIILIQSIIRMKLGKLKYKYLVKVMNESAIKIQTIYRGYKARIYGLSLLYNKYATKIQKIFRGYIIRKIREEIIQTIHVYNNILYR